MIRTGDEEQKQNEGCFQASIIRLERTTDIMSDRPHFHNILGLLVDQQCFAPIQIRAEMIFCLSRAPLQPERFPLESLRK
jgi:hypothetical protein